MQNTDTFIVGHKPKVKAAKAIKEKRDHLGNIEVYGKDAVEAADEVPGNKITLRTPISFPVILKSLEFWDIDLSGTIKAGEVIVKSAVVQDENWAIVEADGTKMMSLCATVAGVYLTPEIVNQVKKNSPQANTSTK